MALTPAEKQKKYRERQKLKAAGLLPEQAPIPKLNLPQTGLSDFIQSTGEDEYPSAVGYIWEDLRHLDLEFLLDGSRPDTEIGRTEKAIEHLSMALSTLTGVLSHFRRHQIDTEIARIKIEDLGDPTRQEDALARLVKLTEVRKRLNKKFRMELFEYEFPEE